MPNDDDKSGGWGEVNIDRRKSSAENHLRRNARDGCARVCSTYCSRLSIAATGPRSAAIELPDDVRLSDIEQRFTCPACGTKGADLVLIFIGSGRLAQAASPAPASHGTINVIRGLPLRDHVGCRAVTVVLARSRSAFPKSQRDRALLVGTFTQPSFSSRDPQRGLAYLSLRVLARSRHRGPGAGPCTIRQNLPHSFGLPTWPYRLHLDAVRLARHSPA